MLIVNADNYLGSRGSRWRILLAVNEFYEFVAHPHVKNLCLELTQKQQPSLEEFRIIFPSSHQQEQSYSLKLLATKNWVKLYQQISTKSASQGFETFESVKNGFIFLRIPDFLFLVSLSYNSIITAFPQIPDEAVIPLRYFFSAAKIFIRNYVKSSNCMQARKQATAKLNFVAQRTANQYETLETFKSNEFIGLTNFICSDPFMVKGLRSCKNQQILKGIFLLPQLLQNESVWLFISKLFGSTILLNFDIKLETENSLK